MKNLILTLMVTTSLVLVGCNRADDNNTSAKFSIKQATSASARTTSSVAATGTFTFTKALVGVSKIDFEMDGEKEDNEIKYTTPFVFDVLTGLSSPAVNEVDIIPGVYHELEFKIDSVIPSGNSVEIAGTYNDGINTYQFEYSTNLRQEFEIENSAGINVVAGQVTSFLLQLDLKLLFKGVDFSKATVGTDGIIKINGTTNTALADIIRHNFEFEHESEMHFEHENHH